MNETRRLRTDLEWIAPDDHAAGRRAQQMLIGDPLTHQFVRVDYQTARCLELQPARCSPEVVRLAATAGLLRQRVPARASGWLTRPLRLLYLRLPGFPALPMARRLAHHTDWLFAPLALLFWFAWIASAVVLLPFYWDRLRANLPDLQSFFSSGNLLLLAGTLVVTKVIHELAHATVCYRLGARPGNLGILLLCGAPCPYCDVSDSVRLPDRMQRIAIMLAGIYVEAICAVVALMVWWFTSSGLLHYAALNVVIVCSVSSLLFNLNPLLRYDGYYVLADLCNSPNLRAEAADAFRAVCLRPLLGRDLATFSPGRSRSVSLAVYAVAAGIYRVVLAVIIAAWLVKLTTSFSLRPVGLTLASALLLGIPATAVRNLARMARGAGPFSQVPAWRRSSLAMAFLLLGGGVLWLPLPHYSTAAGHVDLADATPVYLPADGEIQNVNVDYGQPVSAGQELVTLNNPQLAFDAVDYQGRSQLLRTQTDQLRRRAIEQTSLLEQWDRQMAALESLERRTHHLQARLDELTVSAPCAGHIYPLAPQTQQPANVATFSDPELRQRWLRSLVSVTGAQASGGGFWCRIGRPQACEVILEVDAAQRAYVQVGDLVRVRCHQRPHQVLTVPITSISTEHYSSYSWSGAENRFWVSCLIDTDPQAAWAIGGTVDARLSAPPMSLADRLRRWFVALIAEH